MAYTPPVHDAVYFDLYGHGAYTPPVHDAVYFELAQETLTLLPVGLDATLIGDATLEKPLRILADGYAADGYGTPWASYYIQPVHSGSFDASRYGAGVVRNWTTFVRPFGDDFAVVWDEYGPVGPDGQPAQIRNENVNIPGRVPGCPLTDPAFVVYPDPWEGVFGRCAIGTAGNIAGTTGFAADDYGDASFMYGAHRIEESVSASDLVTAGP